MSAGWWSPGRLSRRGHRADRRAVALVAICVFGLAVWPDAARGAAAPFVSALLDLEIDQGQSELTFTVRRRGEIVDGRAHRFSGNVRVDPSRPEDGAAVELRVVASSLKTGNRMRDRKMRKSHLEVESFPEIRFRSMSIRLAADADSGPAAPLLMDETRKALVEGILSLHGLDRTILFPVTIRYDPGSLTAEGEVGFRLTDHDIPLPRFLWMVLEDEVMVRFRFTAVAAPAAADESEDETR